MNHSSKTIPVNNQAPIFSGVSALTITGGSHFEPRLGVQATDPEDGVIDFTVSGSVEVDVSGTYTLMYSATDSQGLTTTVERTITVISAAQPTITLKPTNSPTPVTTIGTVRTTTTTLPNTGDQILAMTLIAGFSSTVAGLVVIRRRK